VRRAEAIFSALRSSRPQGASPYVGLAMALVNGGRADDAVRELDRGLAAATDEATRAELNAFRGLVLQLAGRASESVRALRSAASHPLAQAMLGEGQPAALQEK
jgi:hypothetical protein